MIGSHHNSHSIWNSVGVTIFFFFALEILHVQSILLWSFMVKPNRVQWLKSNQAFSNFQKILLLTVLTNFENNFVWPKFQMLWKSEQSLEAIQNRISENDCLDLSHCTKVPLSSLYYAILRLCLPHFEVILGCEYDSCIHILLLCSEPSFSD